MSHDVHSVHNVHVSHSSCTNALVSDFNVPCSHVQCLNAGVPEGSELASDSQSAKGNEYVRDDLRTFTHVFYEQNMEVQEHTITLPYFPVNFRDVSNVVGGRLVHFYKNYELLTDNQFLLNVIKYGYKLQFIDNVAPSLTVNAQPFYLNLSPTEQCILDIEMQNFLDNQVIEEVDPATPGWYSPVFLREKRPDNDTDVNAPKKYRVIHDLSSLNKHVVKYKFKMDSSNTVRHALKQGMFFYSIDVKSAYNHVLIHPDSRKYLRCWWRGKAYAFRALPFGLSSAPWIFTSLMSISAKYLHIHSVYSLFYLDDIDVFDYLIEKLQREQPLVLLLLQNAGWILNFPKSHLDITQRGVYIGIDIDLLHGLVFPTVKKFQKLHHIITMFQARDHAPARLWASLLGIITAIQDLTPLGRIQARTIQFHLNSHWKNRKFLLQRVPVTPDIKEALLWWTEPANVLCGTPLQRPLVTEIITTDASLEGYGALYRCQELSGSWTVSQARLHINVLEALCVKKALEYWEHQLLGKSVLIQTDNTTVVSHLNRGSGCRSVTQHLVIRSLLLWCHARQITVTARHLPGRYNQLADLLSRRDQVIATEWTLHPSIMLSIIQTWEQPNLDLFATRWNKQLPVFMSPVLDPTAVAVDAMSQSWTGLTAYAFPPFKLIPSVLNKIQVEPCVIYLVAPCWPRQHHFPLLMDLLVDHPRKIPVFRELLKMPKSHVYHPTPEVFDLHVYKLSNITCYKEDFHQKLQSALVTSTELLQPSYMKSTGVTTYLGVNSQGFKIQSMLLFKV